MKFHTTKSETLIDIELLKSSAGKLDNSILSKYSYYIKLDIIHYPSSINSSIKSETSLKKYFEDYNKDNGMPIDKLINLQESYGSTYGKQKHFESDYEDCEMFQLNDGYMSNNMDTASLSNFTVGGGSWNSGTSGTSSVSGESYDSYMTIWIVSKSTLFNFSVKNQWMQVEECILYSIHIILHINIYIYISI